MTAQQKTRRQRRDVAAGLDKIPLKKPDFDANPDPTQESLFKLAEERGLLKEDIKQREERIAQGLDEHGEPLIGRLGESVLYSMSLTMLYFTLDVLITHQYAVEIRWWDIINRAWQAFMVIFLLFYAFHPHPTPSGLFPTALQVPPRYQKAAHQIFFGLGSVGAGCYLIHITNTYGYYSVMKQAPGMGCLWIWSVIELDLVWAASSLLACIGFLKLGGYDYL